MSALNDDRSTRSARSRRTCGRRSPDDKAALVEAGPWFTISHFDGHNAVLLRERDLGGLDFVELAEVVTDAWACVAPKKLVEQHLG